jgi:transcriptional antiterminator RfaH
MNVSSAAWFVALTQPHAEAKAARHLVGQGFEVYLPRYLKRRSHAGKVQIVAAPLFPRYIFVSIDVLTQRWRAVNSTVGVTQLIRHGEAPAEVAFDIIAALRMRQDTEGFVQLGRRLFKTGDRVRICGGAFSDFLGIFEGMNDCERVAVLLDLLGRKVRVMLNTEVIEAA